MTIDLIEACLSYNANPVDENILGIQLLPFKVWSKKFGYKEVFFQIFLVKDRYLQSCQLSGDHTFTVQPKNMLENMFAMMLQRRF